MAKIYKLNLFCYFCRVGNADFSCLGMRKNISILNLKIKQANSYVPSAFLFFAFFFLAHARHSPVFFFAGRQKRKRQGSFAETFEGTFFFFKSKTFKKEKRSYKK